MKYAYLLALVLPALAACSTVPLTGRHQLSLVSNDTMLATSEKQYGEFLKANKLSADAAKTALVRRVGARVQGAVEAYMAQEKLTSRLAGYNWEFNLVESPEVNAWCMPGGKVVVYTGILPVTGDESGLAVVLGHEIAHAIAEHGKERVSQGMLEQMGGTALAELTKTKPAETQKLWMSAFGAGAQLGALLPFSRLHESEADHLGLIFMAMAGYDPNTAVDFWQRMAGQAGKKPPEFMSTHPSDQGRVNAIRKEIPEAMRYYRPAK
jgi:predicted Zn-dependent protease